MLADKYLDFGQNMQVWSVSAGRSSLGQSGPKDLGLADFVQKKMFRAFFVKYDKTGQYRWLGGLACVKWDLSPSRAVRRAVRGGVLLGTGCDPNDQWKGMVYGYCVWVCKWALLGRLGVT